jgi:hypothetical protein
VKVTRDSPPESLGVFMGFAIELLIQLKTLYVSVVAELL